MIPSLDLSQFQARAKFDFIRFYFALHGDELGVGRERCKSVQSENYEPWIVTIHDPTPAELHYLKIEGDDPSLHGLELTVDLLPRPSVPVEDRQALLQQTFLALAARFRPDDHLQTGAGYKAAHYRPRGVYIHDRLPGVGAELVYGHRDAGANMKLYLKQHDQRRQLPVEQWSVRMEVTLQRYGLYLVGLDRVSSLFGFKYRAAFADWFTVIDRVTVRRNARWSALRVARLEQLLDRRWREAGINALGPKVVPVDALVRTREEIERRSRAGHRRTLDPRPFVLKPHRRAHDMIANALRQLERKMAQRISGAMPSADADKSLMTNDAARH